MNGIDPTRRSFSGNALPQAPRRARGPLGDGIASRGRDRRPRIAYMPYGQITNKYVERFIEILGEFGTVSDLPRPKSLLRRPARLRREFDLAIMNWVEFDLVRGEDGAFSKIGFLKALVRVLCTRCVARRLVYVRHNHFPHGTRAVDVPRARRALDFLERLFDVVLIHSGHEPAAGRGYVPHPLYRIETASPTRAEATLLAGLPGAYYTVFGRIERYKNIERLIAHFPRAKELLVFGAASDLDYADELRRLAGPNVRIVARHVSDAFAQAAIRRSRGLILAHADEDMIVSGSLFYGLSIGARVFAVESPALAWIRARVGDDLIQAAQDLPALCALVESDDAPPASRDAPPPVVEREFGDERIKAVLREVLFA